MLIEDKIPYVLVKKNFKGFPKMLQIEQIFCDRAVSNIEQVVYEEINKLALPDLRDKRIAITVGSRGIPNYLEAIRAIGTELKARGAEPFIVPAMGSHGGATAKGQLELLRIFGFTEQTLKMPIYSSMETVNLGFTEQGVEVNCDKVAFEADGIVVCNRIKPHTDFRDTIESGLCKMMVVGLGNYKGACAFHKTGSGEMGTRLKSAARLFLEKTKILFGVALIDNPYHKTKMIEAILPGNIMEKEPLLLLEAKKAMPRILFDSIDMLIVDEFGKEISGCGMDPNVTGRFIYAPNVESPDYPRVGKIVLLRTTPKCHGNAAGLGVADFISMKFARTLDLGSIYTNCLNSRYSISAKIPMIMNNDYDAIYAAATACGKKNIIDVKIIRIKNTLELDKIMVSENYLSEIEGRRDIRIIDNPRPFKFDAEDNLISMQELL